MTYLKLKLIKFVKDLITKGTMFLSISTVKLSSPGDSLPLFSFKIVSFILQSL